MTGSAEAVETRATGRVTWIVAVLCLCSLAAVFLWYPMARITSYVEVNYNEGWNSYRQQMAAQGIMLYALPPDYAATNYPPLSFHMVGFLGKLTGDMTAAGRWVSVASLLAIALLIAAITRQVSGRWRLGAYAGVLFVIWLAAVLESRVGMNDPQLLGLAFSVLGLCLYVRHPESDNWLAVSALAFAIGLFIKQNLIAFPAATGLHMLIYGSRSRFGRWLASLAVAGGALLLLSIRWDGPYFWTHLLTPRSYSFLADGENIVAYLLRCQIPFAIAALWSIWNCKDRNRNILAIAFVLAHAVGFWFAGGDGVDKNVLFDAMVVVAVIVGVAIGELEPILAPLRFGNVLVPVLLALPAIGSLLFLPIQLVVDSQLAAFRPEFETETSQAVEFLKSRTGPALCENLLLCYEAEKPMLYDAFYVNSQVKTGRIREDDIVRTIASGQFRTIEMEMGAGETFAAVERHRFSAGIMRAIAEHYRPKMRALTFAILVPKNEP
jgi:hypothetical protein